MRADISRVAKGRGPRLLGVFAGIAVSLLLTACASSGGSSGGGLADLFGGGPKASANPAASGNQGVVIVQSGANIDPNYFLKSGYCPPVQVLPGTEALVSYEKGHDGEADYIRSQASIDKTARECHALDAGTLAMKIGVAGRVLAGPKGGAGVVTMPLRIAVTRQHDNSVLYSKVFAIKVTLTAPDLSANYSETFDQVQFKVNPDDKDLIVYVGFDEGAPKASKAPRKAGT